VVELAKPNIFHALSIGLISKLCQYYIKLINQQQGKYLSTTAQTATEFTRIEWITIIGIITAAFAGIFGVWLNHHLTKRREKLDGNSTCSPLKNL
jgi:H+/Cl- antiporter ClcA